MTSISNASKEYELKRVSHWDDLAGTFSHTGLRSYYHKRITKLYREIIPKGERILEIGCARGDLLAALEPGMGVGVDFSEQMISLARESYPTLKFINCDAHNLKEVVGQFDYIIFSDLIDDLWDVQNFFNEVRRLCTPSTRIVFNVYNHLWSQPLKLAQYFGCANPVLPQNWLGPDDVKVLLKLTGFDLISLRDEILLPVSLPFLTSFCNKFLVKFKPFSWVALTKLIVAAPLPSSQRNNNKPAVSVIIPARNEAGNIRQIVERVPQMGSSTELIFIEGGSADNTEDVIRAVLADNTGVKGFLLKQKGSGKGDAVRLGFEKASGEMVMILDADLTVAPEDLPKFYNALMDGRGELINGVRLVYPMHEKAMRFFNLIGNKFFSLAFTWLLGQPIKDTLCGTKAMWLRDYQKIDQNRNYFGDFDPFGDFDLLFGAARLNLKIVDLPVRYGERMYGTTNINRWSHGFILLRMIIFAAKKLKFI